MKMLKLKKGPIIAALIVCAIFLIAGIVFALLPEDTYISWGDYDSAHSRYYPLIIFGILDLIILLIVWVATATQKKSIQKINAIMQNIGEDAIALTGTVVDREAARANATKTALSVVFGFLSALFLGVGFYKIYGNNNERYFVLCNEGLYVYNMRQKTEILLDKKNSKDIKITEKRNSLVMVLVPSQFTFTVKTKGLDISTEELIAKFREVFTNPTIDPYQNV